MQFNFPASHPFSELKRAFQILLEEYYFNEFLTQQVTEYKDQLDGASDEDERLKIKKEINLFFKENNFPTSTPKRGDDALWRRILESGIERFNGDNNDLRQLFLLIASATSSKNIHIAYLMLDEITQGSMASSNSGPNPGYGYKNLQEKSTKFYHTSDFYYQEALDIINDCLEKRFDSDLKKIWERYCFFQFNTDAEEIDFNWGIQNSVLTHMEKEYKKILSECQSIAKKLSPLEAQEVSMMEHILQVRDEIKQFEQCMIHLDGQLPKLSAQVDPESRLSKGRFYYEILILLQPIDTHFKKIKALYKDIQSKWQEKQKFAVSNSFMPAELLKPKKKSPAITKKNIEKQEKPAEIKIEPVEAPSLVLEEKNPQLLSSELLKNITIEQDEPEASQASVSKISITAIDIDSSSQISPIALAPQALSSSSVEEATTSKELPEMEYMALEETVWAKQPKFLPQSSASSVKDESKGAAVFIEDPKGIAQEIIDTVFKREQLLTLSQLQAFVTFLGGKLLPNAKVSTHFRIELKSQFHRLIVQEEEDVPTNTSHKKDTKKGKTTQHSEKKISKEKETVDSLIFGGAQHHSSSKGSGKHLRAWVVSQFKSALIILGYDEKYFSNIVEQSASMSCKKITTMR